MKKAVALAARLRERNRPIRLGWLDAWPSMSYLRVFNNRDDEYRVLLPFIKDAASIAVRGAVHTVSIPIDASSVHSERSNSAPRAWPSFCNNYWSAKRVIIS